MLSQCPRCNAPRKSESPICQNCGFDMTSRPFAAPPAQPVQPQWGTPPPPPAQPQWGQPVQPAQPQWGQPVQQPTQPQWGQPVQQPTQPQWGQPVQQPTQPQWGAPAPQQAYSAPAPAGGNCPRCYAQLTPGYPICSNCGFDTRPAPLPAASRGKRNTPLIIGGVGLALLLAAGGIYAVYGLSSTKAGPTADSTAKATVVAQATSTATPRSTASVASTAPSGAPLAGTPEPAPAGTWTKYTSPDAHWTAKFPGTAKPKVEDLSSSAGASGMKMVMYYATDLSSGAVYAVYVIDTGTSLSGMSSKALLDYMATYMSTYMGTGGTVISTTDTTMGSAPAKEIVIEAKGMVMTMRLGLVGSRFYMLLEGGAPGSDAYPKYFMESFTAK